MHPVCKNIQFSPKKDALCLPYNTVVKNHKKGLKVAISLKYDRATR